MATDKPYRIKEEHQAVLSIVEADKDLPADEYIKIPGGTIIPQTREFGEIEYNGKQAIPVVLVDLGSEDNPATKEVVGEFKRDVSFKGPSADKIAPSGKVAPVSLPQMVPLSEAQQVQPPVKVTLIKVTLTSNIFGKITIPVVEVIRGEGCLVLVTDSSDGFTFIPPVSDTPFTLSVPGQPDNEVFFCGQTFNRLSSQEQFLVLVQAD